MSSLRLLAPPAHTWQLLIWDLTNGDDLRRIRAGLNRFFEAHAPKNRTGRDDVAERVALVATELAGNALRHGLPPVVVRLLRDGDCYVLDVGDHAPEQAPRPALGHQDTHADGRGLLIARSLAVELCWHHGEDTKHVWASFPAPPTAPEHPAGP